MGAGFSVLAVHELIDFRYLNAVDNSLVLYRYAGKGNFPGQIDI